MGSILEGAGAGGGVRALILAVILAVIPWGGFHASAAAFPPACANARTRLHLSL